MSKFKVGDKVFIRQDAKSKMTAFGWAEEMDEYIGKTTVILRIIKNFGSPDEFSLSIDNYAWCWEADCLSLNSPLDIKSIYKEC